MISTAEHNKKFIEVNGKRMAYVEMGEGDPIVFQHGNPTSSYLWRNIMPALATQGRCIAVDLIGSALGFDWACQHPERVKGIAYMEGIVCPMRWDDWPDMVKPIFQGFRSEGGESMVLDKNVFVEKVLPGSVLRGLTDEEMAVYRRPFREPGEDRRPTLTWPRQIPLDGEPADVAAIAEHYSAWLAESDVPKLFINAGALGTRSK